MRRTQTAKETSATLCSIRVGLELQLPRTSANRAQQQSPDYNGKNAEHDANETNIKRKDILINSGQIYLPRTLQGKGNFVKIIQNKREICSIKMKIENKKMKFRK
eukprot:Mrub_11082.p3 GENE.Mrub_11082~~Mrub_11082.p3  ORF type:complete len:105 (+),score=17.17 Mrub_11082:193-507(+)